MTAAARAGLAYVAVVFAVGFVLGALRVTLLVPRLGETLAVLLELPIILAVSWPTCGWLIRRLGVPADWRARAVMGGIAFAALMLLELGVAVLGFGRGVTQHLATYGHWHGALGLAGQVVFALIPLLRRARG